MNVLYLSHLKVQSLRHTIFIDEAHVFSTDRDFRPSVRRLPELTFLPNVRLVMLTATAPQWIMDDIRSNFFGQNRVPIVFRDATNRLNVRYEVNCSCSTFDPVAKQLVELLQNYSDLDRCIIYVPALELCGIVQLALDKVSVPSAIYSGQQDQSTNETSFGKWRDGLVKVMVATSAFGLGIDYPYVRSVYCYGLPYTMEEFVQETGRAG